MWHHCDSGLGAPGSWQGREGQACGREIEPLTRVPKQPSFWETTRAEGGGSSDVGAIDSGNAQVHLEARQRHLGCNSPGGDRETGWPLLTGLMCSL